jgi:hypothetical protein
MQTQTCRVCRAEKALHEFYVRKESGLPRKECKACLIETHRYRSLGVCNVKYDEMLVQQKGACAVCKTALNSSRYTKLAVDHDHRTGRVRGLLCTGCNTALGLMKDSPVRLRAAAVYLEQHGSKEIVSSQEQS